MVKNFLETIIPIILEKNNIPSKDFIAACPFGSINYKLNTSESDLDMIVVLRHGENHKVIELTGEIHFCNITTFIKKIQKRDIKYWECLLTSHAYVSPRLEKEWYEFKVGLLSTVEHLDFLGFLKYKIQEHFDYLLWIPVRTQSIEYYHQKRMYLMLHCREQYEQLKQGGRFQDCLTHKGIYYPNLLEIKTIPNFLSLEEVRAIKKDFQHFLETENPPKISHSVLEQQIINNFLNEIK